MLKTNNNIDNEEILKTYLELATSDVNKNYIDLNTKIEGLSIKEAKKRLNENGKNVTIKEEKRGPIYFFINSLKDEFVLILIFLSIINFLLGDKLGSMIIFAISIISAGVRFVQDYSIYKFNQKLKRSVISKCLVVRNNKELEINVTDVVVGDIVKLTAGSIIPADLKLIETKDLFINQSVYTGESILVEKLNKYQDTDNPDLFNISNIALMSTSVVSGLGTGLVIKTGLNTYLGKVGKKVKFSKNDTNFDKGIKSISHLLLKYMIIVCIFVVIVDGIIKQNFNEALLFALSVAVGITPSMLPMIVNVNLAKGSKRLAAKKTLVKNIASIQNLGSIDILCTDKTGTLTENRIVLQEYIDANGKANMNVLKYAYLNSTYSTGIKNLVDKAILNYGKLHGIDKKIEKYEKIDEIPFDYTRKRQSVVVKNKNSYLMITKGALEEIISNCKWVLEKGSKSKLNKEKIDNIKEQATAMASNGMQVIALAIKDTYPGSDKFNISFEQELTFIGFVAFLDPAKKGVKETLVNLSKINVKTKILTGDNPYATKNICNMVGLNSDEILTGIDIDKMSDEELISKLDTTDVFARMNPIQKERVVSLYKKCGHIVGYMGDGVNDAPSLSSADVGISVNTASSIAKESSDIIILQQSLKVVYDGIIEGRKVYGNIIKYMKMALSGDLGDVFSIMLASIFLPFLPLIPIQMLLQDFIYDFSQLGIPDDNVDPEFLIAPKKWNVKNISRFMLIMGLTSSIIDALSFALFLFVFKYNSIEMAPYFQTAWFVTCLITELSIIFNIRTSKIPFTESNASPKLYILTIFSMILTIITPIVLSQIKSFDFVILPICFYICLISLVFLYFLLVLIVKKLYIKKYGEWL
ncbi:magnesium-translocating P family ATPase [Mycoplasma sp. CAG:956]|nr:magnesium-translocating P family ATPase [Mycoplasma sp. CAG:956]